MTEQELDDALDRANMYGISSGFEQASKRIMEKSVDYWQHGNDEVAAILRDISKDMKSHADNRAEKARAMEVNTK